MSESTQQLRTHIRAIGKLAEVVGALSKEFERQPRVEVLGAMQAKVASLCAEWEKVEAILSSKQNG